VGGKTPGHDEVVTFVSIFMARKSRFAPIP
jgi:hypothetical protein